MSAGGTDISTTLTTQVIYFSEMSLDYKITYYANQILINSSANVRVHAKPEGVSSRTYSNVTSGTRHG